MSGTEMGQLLLKALSVVLNRVLCSGCQNAVGFEYISVASWWLCDTRGNDLHLFWRKEGRELCLPLCFFTHFFPPQFILYSSVRWRFLDTKSGYMTSCLKPPQALFPFGYIMHPKPWEFPPLHASYSSCSEHLLFLEEPPQMQPSPCIVPLNLTHIPTPSSGVNSSRKPSSAHSGSMSPSLFWFLIALVHTPLIALSTLF